MVPGARNHLAVAWSRSFLGLDIEESAVPDLKYKIPRVMSKPHSPARVLKRLRLKVAQGQPIIGAGAGTGLSAKCEEQGGIDLIVIYNSGRFRMAGRGSLAGLMPYGNANQIVKEMAGEVLTTVKHTPVLAGVCGTDPFLLRDRFLKDLIELGFAGIQNFPTVGLVDGAFRQNLEETGMSYQLEVDCIAAAHSLGLLTSPYVFNTNEASRMTKAGADLVVAHMGLTSSGLIGAKTTKSLKDCVRDVQAIVDACKAIRPEVMVLCHGGPIATPIDAQYLFDSCRGLDGFYGASSMERLPTENAITQEIRKFGALTLQVAEGSHSGGRGARATAPSTSRKPRVRKL
jgi:predicted TIM-barrel enzyme